MFERRSEKPFFEEEEEAIKTFKILVKFAVFAGSEEHVCHGHLVVKSAKTHGKLLALGSPARSNTLERVNNLVGGRKMVGGSTNGGLKETQEVLDFCLEHNITADIELIAIDYVNTVIERIEQVDVRYRFVIDIANTLKATS